MKKYIESIEDTKSENKDFIKEEVTDTDKKAKDKCKAKEKSGKKYKRRIHYCNHDEGKPCTVEYI